EALVIDKPGALPMDRPRKGGAARDDRLDELRLGFQRPPAPLHRLDTDTSRCLLLARNPTALKRFAAATAPRQPRQRYHASPAARRSGLWRRQGRVADDAARGGAGSRARRQDADRGDCPAAAGIRRAGLQRWMRRSSARWRWRRKASSPPPAPAGRTSTRSRP